MKIVQFPIFSHGIQMQNVDLSRESTELAPASCNVVSEALLAGTPSSAKSPRRSSSSLTEFKAASCLSCASSAHGTLVIAMGGMFALVSFSISIGPFFIAKVNFRLLKLVDMAGLPSLYVLKSSVTETRLKAKLHSVF